MNATLQPCIEWLDRDNDGLMDTLMIHAEGVAHHIPIKRVTLWPPFSCVCQLEIYYCLHAHAGPLAEIMSLTEDECYNLAGVDSIIIVWGYKPFDTALNPTISAIVEWNRRWREGQLGREQAERQRKERLHRQAEAEAAANPIRNMVAEVKEESARINRVVENHPITRVKRLEEQLAQLQRENLALRQKS